MLIPFIPSRLQPRTQTEIVWQSDFPGDGDTSDWSSFRPSGSTISLSHSWSDTGTYLITAQAKDKKGAKSEWSSGFAIQIRRNQSPNTPSGPTSGIINISYTFTAYATDPDSDSVSIRFDWGDGDTSEWSSYLPSGSAVALSHSWSSPGTYYVKAQAKDVAGATSGWSEEHGIRIIATTYPYTIALTWAKDPRDLDAHIWTPEIQGEEYHIYFANQGSLNNVPYCSLDVDDITSYGPEHIILSQTFPGTYTYAVHHFSGDSTITTSRAKVEVYHLGNLVQSFEVPRVPSGYRWWWHVFNLDGATGTITPLNQIDSLPPRPWLGEKEKNR
jgi:hypothetical protein